MHACTSTCKHTNETTKKISGAFGAGASFPQNGASWGLQSDPPPPRGVGLWAGLANFGLAASSPPPRGGRGARKP